MEQTRICPHCRKDIDRLATKCPFCQSVVKAILTTEEKRRQRMPVFVGAAIIASFILLASGLWYIFVVGLIAWYLWKKHHFSFDKKIKVISFSVLVALIIVGIIVLSYANRTPVLTIQSPANGGYVEASSVNVIGKVSPSNSSVTINGIQTSVASDGSFVGKMNLPSSTTTATIEADNGPSSIATKLSVFRLYSPAEVAEKEAQAAAAAQAQERAAVATEQARQEAAAATKAAQEAYNNSPAGKICVAHPSWSADVCVAISQGDLVIGMTEDQARMSRGTPSEVNSNTNVNGTLLQWVYEKANFHNSYIYFENGILTSYQN